MISQTASASSSAAALAGERGDDLPVPMLAGSPILARSGNSAPIERGIEPAKVAGGRCDSTGTQKRANPAGIHLWSPWTVEAWHP